jgi:hypothetical protein
MRNGVIAAHDPLDLDAQDIAKHRRIDHERALGDLRWLGEPRVVRRNINRANSAP